MGRIIGTQLADATLSNTQIASNAAIAFSKLASLTSGNLLVGNGSNVPTSVAMAGDISIDNAGTTAIAAGVIVNADVNASAAIDDTKVNFDTSTGHDHDGTNSKSIGATVKIWRETPTGTIDNSNTLYTLATAPNADDMLVFLNGISLDLVATAAQANEFEHVSGATVFTTGDAPNNGGDGDTLLVHYQPA